jgi:hypothetical protein
MTSVRSVGEDAMIDPEFASSKEFGSNRILAVQAAGTNLSSIARKCKISAGRAEKGAGAQVSRGPKC